MILKIIIYSILAFVFIIAVMYGIGRSMPVEHTVSLVRNFKASPETVYTLIKNFKEYPEWRKNISIEPTSDTSWRELDAHGDKMTYAFIQDKKNSLIESKIMDEDKPFGGSWVFVIHATKEGSELMITENGKVYPPLFRFLVKYVFGHTSTMKSYLDFMQAEILKRN